MNTYDDTYIVKRKELQAIKIGGGIAFIFPLITQVKFIVVLIIRNSSSYRSQAWMLYKKNL